MNTSQSVYPPAVVDKCVELLCSHHCGLQPTTERLTTARFLMMFGCVELHDGKGWKSARFAVMSPDTPRFYYAVDLRSETCTCADFLRYQRPCKHMYAVVLTLLAWRRLGFIPRMGSVKGRVK
jgi:SWIM zinc finger